MPISSFEAVISILGEPIALQRARIGKAGNWYDPSAREKESFAVQCLAQWRPDGFPTKANFAVDVSFHCTGPSPTSKDGDNMLKLVLDSLNGLYWADDKQVKDCHIHVFDNSDNPRTVLMIKVLYD